MKKKDNSFYNTLALGMQDFNNGDVSEIHENDENKIENQNLDFEDDKLSEMDDAIKEFVLSSDDGKLHTFNDEKLEISSDKRLSVSKSSHHSNISNELGK